VTNEGGHFSFLGREKKGYRNEIPIPKILLWVKDDRGVGFLVY
jgi:hypothetical protein